ncbi:hypothetical protein M3Y97_00266700 [Aphelenchoides bicaudatus]|nr:hypothetical protein M3Y97_00266700 [Aphelenchoides bicaudatus]
MHSVLNILFNAILIFGTTKRGLAGLQLASAELVRPNLHPGLFDKARIEDFVPMERITDQEVDYYSDLLQEITSELASKHQHLPAQTSQQGQKHKTSAPKRKVRAHRHQRV